MRNLFYCVYENEVHQGRLTTLQIPSKWIDGQDWFIFGDKTPAYYCNVGQLAGVNGFPKTLNKVYETIEDCRSGNNEYSLYDFAQALFKSIIQTPSNIKVKENQTGCNYEFKQVNGNFAMRVYYWVWNGLNAEYRNVSAHCCFDILNGILKEGTYGNTKLEKDIDKYGKVYLTKKECEEDNVMKVICFPDEEV